MEKGKFATPNGLPTGCPQAKKIRHSPYAVCKNELEMDHRLKFKRQKYKTFRRKGKRKSTCPCIW